MGITDQAQMAIGAMAGQPNCDNYLVDTVATTNLLRNHWPNGGQATNCTVSPLMSP
jgi:hypothetical protein